MSKKKDLTEKSNYFFPPGPELEKLRDGVNYTEETLSYMTPWKRAEEVTRMLEKAYTFEGVKKKFAILDLTSGVGGNILSFLKSDQVSFVMCHERVAERNQMLKNNIRLYGLERKAIVAGEIKEDFFAENGQVLNFPAGCVHVDPPWLPPNIPPNQDPEIVKKSYIMSGMEIAGMKVEELIRKLTNKVYVFAIRFPPGYAELEKVEGWKYERIDIYSGIKKTKHQSTFYICKSDIMKKYIDKYAAGPEYLLDKMKKEEKPFLISYNREEKKEKKKDGRSRDFSSWKKWGSSLPGPSRGVEPLSDKWRTEYKNYIMKFLKITHNGIRLINNNHILQMTSDENMEIWIKAVVSETKDINYNYETLEILGDALLEYSFKKYIAKIQPKITTSLLSEYKSRYMSKEFQGDWAKMIRLDEWIVTDLNYVKPIRKMYTDVFESIFGALDIISDNIKGGGGALNCINYISVLFKDVVFDEFMRFGTYKTIIVQQYSQVFRWDVKQDGRKTEEGVTAKTTQKNGEFETKMLLNDTALKFINKLMTANNQPKVKNPFVIATGRDSDESKNEGYKMTYERFAKIGLNLDYVELYREATSFLQFDKNEIIELKTKYESPKLWFYTVTKASVQNKQLVQLKGTKIDGEVILISTGTGETEDEARKNAFVNALLIQRR